MEEAGLGKVSLVYKGFHGEAEQVDKTEYQGRIINVPEPAPLRGSSVTEIQTSFTWMVERLIKEGVQPGPVPSRGPEQEEAE
jgi:hypothetical protein